MANYYNPYNIYPSTAYQPNAYPYQQSYAQQPAPAYQQSATPMQLKAMEWVEGEVGAKAFQMPAGLPANQPIPLWDSTDTVIWLKSWGPMGIPNPLQRLKYEMPEQQNQQLLNGASGNTGMSQGNYATKEDIEGIREEIRKLKNGVENNA